MIPRCRPISRVFFFFIVTSIVHEYELQYYVSIICLIFLANFNSGWVCVHAFRPWGIHHKTWDNRAMESDQRDHCGEHTVIDLRYNPDKTWNRVDAIHISELIT
jgi:hypothetical protein